MSYNIIVYYNNKMYNTQNNNHFKIVIVLDESGSMLEIEKNIINSLNIFISDQKQIIEKPATLTLVKFNDEVNTVIDDIELKYIESLTDEDYKPNGYTALYDAIGNTIVKFPYEKDLLLVVITDGHDNASVQFNLEDIKKMLDVNKEENNWSYVYLCNNLSTFEQGKSLGLDINDKCSNLIENSENFDNFISNNLNNAIKNYRKVNESVQTQLNLQYNNNNKKNC